MKSAGTVLIVIIASALPSVFDPKDRLTKHETGSPTCRENPEITLVIEVISPRPCGRKLSIQHLHLGIYTLDELNLKSIIHKE